MLLIILCRHPDRLRKLQEELDAAFPSPLPPDYVAPFSQCQDLQFTQGVLYETLRLRTTVSVGLPRVVVKGGATVCCQLFKEGTVLSVPTSLSTGTSAYGVPMRWSSSRKGGLGTRGSRLKSTFWASATALGPALAGMSRSWS